MIFYQFKSQVNQKKFGDDVKFEHKLHKLFSLMMTFLFLIFFQVLRTPISTSVTGAVR